MTVTTIGDAYIAESVIRDLAETTLFWPVPKELTSSPEVLFRNELAEQLKTASVAEILLRYLYTNQAEMEFTVDLLGSEVLEHQLRGNGMELGAGCGLFSCTFLKTHPIKSILALEVVEKMATHIIPKVAAEIVHDRPERLVPVVGSFDDMRLEDNSLDFVLEIDSLHHSPNLPVTLKEINRVLKPGGVLLCLDRSHPNWVTDKYIEEQLNRVYPKKFLRENGYPEDVVLTREQNGEHEYRIGEWLEAFDATGFEMIKTAEFWNTVNTKMAFKSILSILPPVVRKKLYKGDDIPVEALKVWLLTKFKKKQDLYGRHGSFIFTPYRKTVMLVKKLS